MTDPIRVLYVDADSGFAETAAQRLEREFDGFSVATETDADGSLDRLDDDASIDCVVSDYRLSNTDGLELLSAVREDHPNLPFILFTDHGSEGIASEAISMGVTDYLRKNSDHEQFELLANRITAVTDRRKRDRRIESLHESTRRLMQADSKQEIAEIAADAAENTLGYSISVVRLVDDGGRTLVPAAVTESAQNELGDRPVYRVGEGPPGTVYEHGEPSIYDDVQQFTDGYDWGDVSAGMFLPIGDHGTLSVGDRTVDAFDQSDLRLASLLAANAEAALDRVEREQKLARQNERLEEFASVVSHDIKTPLNVALGRLDMVREECDSDHLDAVESSVFRMEQILDDVLTAARQGQDVDRTEPVAFSRIVEESWSSVDTGPAELHVEADAELVFEADPSRAREVLENLFRNAAEHAGEDPAVTVGVLDVDDGFFVEDDGPGIPPDDRDVVFEAGYSTSEDGTGFGLNIVKRIVEAHGWDITATEGTDGGMRFEITGVAVDGSAEPA